MDILAQLLGIKVGHDFIEDFGRAIMNVHLSHAHHRAQAC
jgi:hypothetical protein